MGNYRVMSHNPVLLTFQDHVGLSRAHAVRCSMRGLIL